MEAKRDSHEFSIFESVGVGIPTRRTDAVRNTLTLFELFSLRYGIGKALSYFFFSKIGYNPQLKKKKVYSTAWLSGLIPVLQGLLIQQDSTAIDLQLSIYMRQQLRSHMRIKTVRGLRYRMGYPVRGQRTRSNYRTARHLRIKLAI